jgi:hypothetical protein
MKQGARAMSGSRRLVVDWLNRNGGEVQPIPPAKYIGSEESRADAGYTSSGFAWAGLLKKMDDDGVIERDVHGKRTLAIRLLPPYLIDTEIKVEELLPPVEELEPEPEPPAAEPKGFSNEVLDGLLDGLLMRLIERLTAQVPEPVQIVEHASERETQLTSELEMVKERLAIALSDAQKYRSKVSAAEDSARAATEQATQLRRDKRTLEDNIKALTKTPKIDDRQRLETQRLMEDPARAKGRKET